MLVCVIIKMCLYKWSRVETNPTRGHCGVSRHLYMYIYVVRTWSVSASPQSPVFWFIAMCSVEQPPLGGLVVYVCM